VEPKATGCPGPTTEDAPVRESDGSDVFIATTGRALTYPMINGTFHFRLRSVELQAPKGGLARAPRIHDLRHRFAVRALECAAADRHRIAQHVLALSTYLGHAHVADTYWYLHATPHLMRQILRPGPESAIASSSLSSPPNRSAPAPDSASPSPTRLLKSTAAWSKSSRDPAAARSRS
jgi:hypothetical protein